MLPLQNQGLIAAFFDLKKPLMNPEPKSRVTRPVFSPTSTALRGSSGFVVRKKTIAATKSNATTISPAFDRLDFIVLSLVSSHPAHLQTSGPQITRQTQRGFECGLNLSIFYPRARLYCE